MSQDEMQRQQSNNTNLRSQRSVDSNEGLNEE